MIRFQRVGRRNDPSFRLIVCDSRRAAKTGAFLELLGSYNPKTKATTLKNDRILKWHKDGAQISDTVRNFLITNKVIEGKKVNVLPRKSPVKKEAGKEATPKPTSSALEPAPVKAV